MIARAWAKRDTAQFQSLLAHSYVAMTMLVAPLVVGTYMFGGKIMTIVAGPDFAASGEVLKILMFAVAFIFFGTVSSHAVVALDAQRRMLPIYILTAIATLAGYAIFIPTYGLWAAAWLTVFSEGCVALGSTLISLRISRTRLLWSPLIKTVGAALVMGLALEPLKDVWLPVPILVGACIYAALIVVSGALSKATLRELLAFRKGAPTIDVV
jgi:O-antigen/teichoic acid export membrane protein